MRESGFTIIETLVALLVIAIAYAGVTTAVSHFADQRALLAERYTGHRIAWNQMQEEFRRQRGLSGSGSEQGDAGEIRRRGTLWRWSASRERTRGGALVLYRLEVGLASDSGTGVERDVAALSAFFVP